MAATRLRKTFHYPDSSDDEDTVEAGMDAQDRETLITTLQTHDTTSTRLYTQLLLALPACIAILTLPGLLSIRTLVPSLFVLASLVTSAYTLYYLPLPPRRAEIISGGAGQVGAGRARGYKIDGQAERKQVPWLGDEMQELLAHYIISANGVVCGLFAVLEMTKGREWREGMLIGGGYVPGLVFSVVMWARRELRVVDMSELQQQLRS
ncbi:hypothetical protein E8E13_002886 [Curvularia kusanoi]|uniref:Uncharacterized protein n=1 Tax=Curvularia kusanoi TaxID=90978 RepID=A0A9P4T8R1_CURKU|nr:hypothetical protein E8E13_002886 [Curvularia kusanoi]